MNETREGRGLLISVAAVWLATAVLVLHPHYREVGEGYLAQLGLPPWLMYAPCLGELVLGLRVAFGPPDRWLAGLQTAAVAGFTGILGVLEPMLLVSPVGVLSKNIPLLTALWAATLLAREGWTTRVLWILRGGVAAIWLTEGLLPKIFFQQEWELSMSASLIPADPSMVVGALGVAQAASGIAVLLLPWRPLRWLLFAQAAALVALPLMVSLQEPLLWVHPFGPLTKNLPIIAGTLILASRCSTRS